MTSFLFMPAKVKKISSADMLTLLDEIFIVVTGVGTFIEKIIFFCVSVILTANENLIYSRR